MLSADAIASYTSEGIARKNLWTWFDRFDSKSNPVDGLSRGDATGDWELRDIVFPPDLLENLKECLEQNTLAT